MDFIHLIGENKVGKTTLAKSLYDFINVNTKRCCSILAFADAVRDELIHFYGIPHQLAFNKTINKNTYEIDLGDYEYDPEMEKLWKQFGLMKKHESMFDITLTFRELFVNHATHVRRVQDPLYWVKAFHNRVKELNIHTNVDLIITDDVRHGNEINSCTEPKDNESLAIFWLENELDHPSDVTQDVIKQWYSNNKDRCIHVPVPVPLDNKICTDLVTEELLPALNIT